MIWVDFQGSKKAWNMTRAQVVVGGCRASVWGKVRAALCWTQFQLHSSLYWPHCRAWPSLTAKMVARRSQPREERKVKPHMAGNSVQNGPLKARIRRRRRGRRCALGGGAEVLQQPVVNTMVEQIIACYGVGSSVGCSVGSSRRTCCLGRTPHRSKQVSPEGLHPVEDSCLCKGEVWEGRSSREKQATPGPHLPVLLREKR